jgi:DNA-binding transcriptional LysR family regulator
MPNLRAIETFVKALEGGSIASAARQLGISPAAASQNIARLERELGTRLITRTTRSMALTEAGERYLARVAPVLDELEKAQSDLSLIHGELQGRLRIACMAAFGRHVLAPLLPAFTALHPRLELELLITDRHVDVLKEDVDISVRYRDVLEPGMSVRLLASVPRILCASPQYLQQHGRPQTAQELLEHACLLYRRERDGRLMRWPFLRDGQRTDPQQKIAAIGSDIDALVEFAAAGGGIAWAGSFIVHEELRRAAGAAGTQAGAQGPVAVRGCSAGLLRLLQGPQICACQGPRAGGLSAAGCRSRCVSESWRHSQLLKPAQLK